MFDKDLDIWEEDLEGLLFRVDRCFIGKDRWTR